MQPSSYPLYDFILYNFSQPHPSVSRTFQTYPLLKVFPCCSSFLDVFPRIPQGSLLPLSSPCSSNPLCSHMCMLYPLHDLHLSVPQPFRMGFKAQKV